MGSIVCKSSHAELIVMKNFPQFRSEHRAKTISQTPHTAHNTMTPNLCESGRAGGAENLLVVEARNTVGKREREILGDQLLDVRALDVLGLLDLNDTENLHSILAITLCLLLSWDSYVNRPETGTVASSHVLVEGINGLCS